MQTVTSDSIYTEGVPLAFQKELSKISTEKSSTLALLSKEHCLLTAQKKTTQRNTEYLIEL